MAKNPNRPISPHLDIYRRGPAMMVSITHRATGFILATVGVMTLLWWLAAIGGGIESYTTFRSFVVDAGKDAEIQYVVINWFFRLALLAVLFSFFQHLFSGIRHLVMDMGANFELGANNTSAWLVYIASMTATGVAAFYIIWKTQGL